MKDIQVVILLGGLGTRLSDAGFNGPKAMIDIYGKPFFYYQLHLMKQYGLKNFVFCIGYKGDVIKSFFQDGHRFAVNIKYSCDGRGQLGTGGALRKALPLLKEDFMVIYGDSYMDVDYSELVYTYYRVKKDEGKKGLMAVFKNKNRYDTSNVIFKGGKLLKYDKQDISSDMEYIDYGISILNKNVVKKIPKGKYFDLSCLYRELVKKELISGYEAKKRFYEIGAPSSLHKTKKFIYQNVILKKPAVLFDRDGTLNPLVYNDNTEELDSPLDPEKTALLPGVVNSLRMIKRLGYNIIVITNQPAAAKGKTTLGKLYEINNRLRDILAEKDIYLDDILICPHHPVGSRYCKERFLIKKCMCRKPKPGLINTAVKKFNIDLDKSYMVGDSYTDIQAGKSAGLKSVFIGKYKYDGCRYMKGYRPDYVFNSIYDFACYLKKMNGKNEMDRRSKNKNLF